MRRWYLVVAGGTCEPKYLAEEVSKLHQEMAEEDSLYVIGADAGVRTLLTAGVPIDFAIGDFDSGTAAEKELVEKKEIKGIILNPIKDDTDSESAAQHILEREQNFSDKDCTPEVRLYGVTGTRLDHSLANIYMLKKYTDAGIKAVICNENNHIRVLRETTTIQRSEVFGKYISFLPLLGDVYGISLKGFKYSGEGITLKVETSLGISNELSDDEGKVSFESGNYLIMMETCD